MQVPAADENVPVESPMESMEGDYLVEFWRSAQGLPNNTVNALLQSRDGYLWAGTAAGLARFDGLTFTEMADPATPGLSGACITALLEDREGALWVGTQGAGLLRLGPDRAAGFVEIQGLGDRDVTSLAVDASGVLWIGTQSGLSCWLKGRLAPLVSEVMPARDAIVALHAGRSGTLWVTTRSGVFRLQNGVATPFQLEDLPQSRNAEFIGAYEDSSGNLWALGSTFLLNVTQGRRFNYFRSQELASSRVWTICEQTDGTFWIGSSGRGLFRFQNGRFRVTGSKEGLAQSDVRALYADRWGNLWIGTSGNGLARLRPPRLSFVSAVQGGRPLEVTAIAPAAGEALWVGTADAGLLNWDGRRFEPFADGPPFDRVTQIQTLASGRDGALWVGTWGAGLWQLTDGRQRRFTTADGLSDDVVLTIAADPESDAIWVGTQSGNLQRAKAGRIESLGPLPGTNGGAISTLLPGPKGTLRVGTEAGGLARWDGSALVLEAGPAELPGKAVRCLFEDRKHRLWVGSWGGGAFCRTGDRWVRLGRRQGLGSDAIGLIVQDEAGDYWFGTGESLYRARAVEVEAFLEGKRSDVVGVPVASGEEHSDFRCAPGHPAVAQTAGGVMWLATATGLLPLSGLERTSAEPVPPVILEGVLVDGRPRSAQAGAPLKLGTSVRSLDFLFTAITFTAPQKARFRHKLENFDAGWVEGDVSRRAHYGPLPPGRYEFRVIASNADGVWNQNGASLALIVVPPVWRAWWFLTLCGLASGVAIAAVVRAIATRRLRARLRLAEQRHAMDRERARIAQDMHDEIGSKLTRISFLSEIARHAGENSPEVAPPVEAIASTSRELLQALDEIVWAVNPRNDNLEHLAGYLEQHAREYFQKTEIVCEIQVPPQLPSFQLSAEVRHNVFLAFEEALNNTLKHARASRVGINMQLTPGAFEIHVEDNGQGFAPGVGLKPEQDGLANMRARLQAVGGSCEISSQPGRGTRILLRFPLKQPPAGDTGSSAEVDPRQEVHTP